MTDEWEQRVSIDHPAFAGDEQRKIILRSMYRMADCVDVRPRRNGGTNYKFILDYGAYKGHSTLVLTYKKISPISILDLRIAFGFSVHDDITRKIMEIYCND